MQCLSRIAPGIAALALSALPAPAAEPADLASRYARVVVHGASLEGNLAGDSPDRQVSIYLPPSYSKERTRRYPVLYLLHGFTDSDARWFGLLGEHFVHVPKAVDASFARGTREMIVVMPDAFTKFQGSMYSSSVVNGDWETFVTRELVAYVDANYRTLARRASRGLAGHSMGGYGTLRLAMKSPGVFAALYVMSPCCLAPNTQWDPQAVARAHAVRTAEEIAAADFVTKAILASAAAWSPNPKKPPLYVDLPGGEVQSNVAVLSAWAASAPNYMLHQYIPALKGYDAIAIDAGDQDPVPAGVGKLHQWLVDYEIPHEFEMYPGDHLNRVQERLTSKVLPFFSERLAFGPPAK